MVLDQVIEAIRADLSASIGPGGDPARVAGLAGLARRLAAIDPERRGAGGLRLQLELALFASPTRTTVDAPRPAAATDAQPVPSRPVPAAPPSPPVEAVEVEAVETDSRPSPRSKPIEPAPSDEPELPTVPDPVVAPPVPSSPAATPPLAATPAPSGPDVDRLVSAWPEIVASVRPATRAIITECRPIAVDGNIVTLGFPEAKAFLKDIAERKRPDLEAAVGGFLGRAVNVRCVATNIDLVPPAAAGDEAGLLLAEARRIFAEELADVGEVS